MAAWTALPPDHIAHAAQAAEATAALEGDPNVILWGVLDDEPVARASGVGFVLRADSAMRGDRAQRVSGLVQVTLAMPRKSPWSDETPPMPVYPALHTGDRIAVAGPLGVARGRSNPADFDYRLYLARRGIHATLRADGAEAVAFLAPSGAVPTRFANALRQRVERALGAHVASEDARAVLAALLVADRSRIGADTREQFVQAGLVHLLAVSGLHVLLVGFVLYGVLGPLLGRLGVPRRGAEWSRSAFTFLLLAAYVLVTGGAVPVVRAFVMATVVLAGRAMEKPFDTLNTLGVAALVLLMGRPAALFEVGFQLSFGAVAALATLTPLGLLALRRAIPERTLARGPVRWSAEMTLASGAATIGTAPALLVHFGRVPLAGLVLNLAAIPLTAASLGAGLLTTLLAPLAPPAADIFGAFANVSALLLLKTSEVGASGLGWLSVDRFVSDGLLIAAMGAALGALAMWLRPRARWRLALLSVALVVLAGWRGLARGDGDARLDIVFLDVGQGDATLLAFPGGQHVLIDAGPATPTWDNGERTVLPHLKRYGVKRLDLVVATHPDADHTGGLPAVLRGVEVGRLVHNGDARGDGPWAETLRLADSLGLAQQAVGCWRYALRRARGPRPRPRAGAPGPRLWRRQRGLRRAAGAVRPDRGPPHGRRRGRLGGRDAGALRPAPPRRRGEGGPPRLAHVVHAAVRAGRQRRARDRVGRRLRRAEEPLRAARRGASGAVGRQRRGAPLHRRRGRGLAPYRRARRHAGELALICGVGAFGIPANASGTSSGSASGPSIFSHPLGPAGHTRHPARVGSVPLRPAPLPHGEAPYLVRRRPR